MSTLPPASGVEVRLLGCGDAFASGGRLHACFHLRYGERSALIDCGATSLVALRRFEVDPASLDLVLVSHLHGDHFAGLPFLLLDGQFSSRRERPLHLAGPPGLEQRLRQAQEIFFPGSSAIEWRFPLELTELEERRTIELLGLEITALPVVHASGAPAYALRIACGDRVIAYSGDTEWTETLVEVARGADLFLCECYRYDKRVPFHLDYRTLASHLPELECRRILLVHLHQDMLDRDDAEVELERGEEGMRLRL